MSPVTPTFHTNAVPIWVRVLLVVCAALMGLGAMIALANPGMLVGPGAEINSAVRTYAGYLTSRNLTLGIMLIFLLGIGARRALGQLAAIVGFIQILDFLVDCSEKRWTVAAGVLILGTLLLIAAARVTGRAFWRAEAWT